MTLRVSRVIRAVIVVLLFLSLTGTLLCILPVANNLYWPAVAVSMELWPWFLVINVLGLLLGRLRSKLIAATFAVGFVISVWPLWEVSEVTAGVEAQWQRHFTHAVDAPGTARVFFRSFIDLGVPEVVPRQVHEGVLFYSAPSTAGELPKPVIIDIHGGGWHYGSPNDDDVSSRFLAGKGYAVFSIPYRLAPAYTFPAQLDDVREAMAWVHAHCAEFGADSTRIVLMGRSAGGNLALLAGYTLRDIPIRGVIGFYPATDLKEMYNDPPQPDPHNVPLTIAEFLGGTPDQVPEKYARASPVTFVTAGLPPTLILQGSRDKIQKARFPRTLHDALTQRGNVSVLVELPWSHHSFDFVYFCPGGQLAQCYIEQFLSETTRREH